MSARIGAWADLVNWDGSDAYLELCNAAMLEVQREARRKALREAADAVERYDYDPGAVDPVNVTAFVFSLLLRRMADGEEQP